MSEQPVWCVMPILAAPELTEAAIADLLAQSVPTRLLLVNQGVDDAFRTRLERIAEQEAERVFLWNHMPPLPSLSATWNRALEFVWAVGSEEALVVNNDLRLHRQTVEYLRRILQREHALFVSAVGVTAEQFDSARVYSDYDFFDAHSDREDAGFLLSRGGPDFSCSLISRACHERFRFDEGCTPAYLEDLSYHRDLMLAGEGQRIFSVNLPYLHYASGTLKALGEKARADLERQIAWGSRRYYRSVWGGDANQETFLRRGDPYSAVADGSATTAALFEKERTQWASALKT